MYKDGLPVRGGECPTNKGREGRGRGKDWCILGRQRKDSRCSGYAGPAFIPISDDNTQFSFWGITPPLSTLSSSSGVANLIPSVWGHHMTESGQSEHHILWQVIGSGTGTYLDHASQDQGDSIPFVGTIWI